MASTAPARRSSPVGWPSGPSTAVWPSRRCRSRRPRRRCTGWKLSTAASATTSPPPSSPSALRPVLDAWIYALEEDVLATSDIAETDTDALSAGVDQLLDRRLGDIARNAPAFASALRGYRTATGAGDQATAEGLAAWLGGQPNVASVVRRAAGLKGELDHFGALAFLQGLLTVLRGCGHPGLLIVLDEVETLQRMRSDVRDKALNALRQLIDEVDGGRFPGLYLVITGTPAFFDGVQGAQRLPRWRSGWPPTSPRTSGSTTRGRSNCDCPGSPPTGCATSADASGTCS